MMMDNAAEYLAVLEQRIPQLDEELRPLAAYLIELATGSYVREDEDAYVKSRELLLAMAGEGGYTPALFEPLVRIVRELLGEEWAQFLAYITEHAAEYPHGTSYARRPFRHSDASVHMLKVYNKLLSLLKMHQDGFVLIEYLTTPQEGRHYVLSRALGDRIAFELDQGSVEVKEALKEIIYGENQTALLTHEMISGIVMSHDEEAYRMLGELLIAARLQEGLRQSIVERMDEGTLAGTLYILKLIIDHDFIRYSSVVRGLGVWTGMGLEAANHRVAGQLIEQAYLVLTDETIRETWLSSDNANQVYLSLWATAVHEERDLYERIDKVMKQGEIYQKIVAQYVLANSENKDIRFRTARLYLHETDPELRYWLLNNYAYALDYTWKHDSKNGHRRQISVWRHPLLEDKSARRHDFEQLLHIARSMRGQEQSRPSKVLDFAHVTYDSDLPVRKLLYLTAYDMDTAWIAELIALKDLVSTDLRGELLSFFMQDTNDRVQRDFLFASLSDKSMKNRELALETCMELDLTGEELQQLEALLKLKTGSLRQSVIGLLLLQPEEKLACCLERLLLSKIELQRLAALEVIAELSEDEQKQEQYERIRPLVSHLPQPTRNEQLLIDKLSRTDAYTQENGFGLYDPASTESWLLSLPESGDFQVADMFTLEPEAALQFLKGLDELIHEHREVEYEAEYYAGYKEKLLIGTMLRRLRPWDESDQGKELAALPLAEVWEEYLNKSGFGPEELLQLQFYSSLESLDQSLGRLYRYFSHTMEYQALDKHRLLEGERGELAGRLYPLAWIKQVQEAVENCEYSHQVRILLQSFYADSHNLNTFNKIDQMLNAIMQSVTEAEWAEHSGLIHLLTQPWRGLERRGKKDDASFRTMFHTLYTFQRLEKLPNSYSELDLDDYLRAFQSGLIGEGELYKVLLSGKDCRNFLQSLTSSRYAWIEEHPQLLALRSTIIDRLLQIELGRGELPTEATPLAMRLQKTEGIAYWTSLLSGLDKDPFVRGYVYSYNDSFTKKETFSHLLKICHPKAGEDADLLRTLLQGKGISEKRLLEAAMYAPQWIEIVAEYLDWPGLRKAAWYFHAHINESFSAEKETTVAHYSPITPQEFNDGAFDIAWFEQAYQELGAERFEVLYQAAKYISAGGNHRRSQLFADAVLGRLNKDELVLSVNEKRNKDHLLSYSLLPLDEDRDRDIRERYELIQRFLKQSKTFGAQRQASEGQAAEIALGNLARNAGYADVIRLKWDMEGRKLDDLLSYFQPYALDEETSVQLVIDEQGQSDIELTSKGKLLKSVPARYKKHEHLIALKAAKSELTDQYRRAREELEKSMVAGSAFTKRELTGLFHNPVIRPLVKALVWTHSGSLGYFDPETGRLVEPSGETTPLVNEADLLIAHPLHLYRSGRWSEYQKDLYDRQLRQPFKQIFRELYLPNTDELDNGTVSRRYAGHQVQPKKTVALLKGRKWTVSYEEGLQKVYHAENVIASLYAMADWFSPADTEAPTLETVQFMDRTTYKSIPFRDVPELVFSEVMRDIDLVVSVAHVGGVDPEASLSTVEMRRVIVAESVRLLKLDQVRVEGHYALIRGKLGEYSVHLGSGQVYKQAQGALHIIPVHAQHRGRLFLPFMDEDPRTAEIVSKIALLAEDTKIKDPSILMQLQ
ncbi:DUF4132 domain-containing protein [Paenibacillus filicis]|uniref:DUF4132 domain-containing protein n=1 Tax=Paenibacillus filicis TaxID=669464 RepID=A0ABU9DN93_9BACL